MRKRITRIIAVVLLMTAMLALMPAISVPAATNDSSLQKLPDSYTVGSGEFTIKTSTRFFLVSNTEPTAEMAEFAQFISQQFAGAKIPSSATLPIVWGPANYAKAGDIILQINYSAAGNAAESYKITANSNNITITGADKRGLMYGAFMVIKTLRANGSMTFAGCTIQDTPDAAERTVMLDCGRKYYTAEWIKNFIREMAYMGYNSFEMHFAEDQGFRIDIWDEEYFTSPNGNDFSWVSGGMVGSWVPSAYQSYTDVGKYLTAKEIVEILEVAKQYQIDVIPSFDTPMHCQYLRRMWSAHVGGDVASELGNRYTVNENFSFVYNGNKYSSAGITNLSTGKNTVHDGSINNWYNIMVKNDSGVRSGTKVIDVTNAVGRNLMLALIEDFAAFFKQYGCTDFNICADEVAFYTNDYAATYAQKVLGITNGSKYDTFTHYVNEATNMLQDKYGYNVRIFSDFVDLKGSGNYLQHLTFDKELEIVYWTLPESAATGVSVKDVSHFVNNNYKIYNAVENYCYYVLAQYNGKDDRGGVRSNWANISEQDVWNYWNPTVFTHRSKGETNVVSADAVAGGYFLIWCDYGAMSTESQIWSGIDSSGTYNVIDRMWSNIYKMWNYDVNSSLSYSNFATLREKLGDFPGYTSCTAKTTLPAAKSLAREYLADHTQLKAAIATVVDPTEYTAESYANYAAALETAKAVCARYDATQAEVDNATTALKAAIAALTSRPFEVTVYHKTMVGTTERVIKTEVISATPGVQFQHYLSPIYGYYIHSVEGCELQENPSGAQGGTLYGTTKVPLDIVVWYDNNPNIATLKNLVVNPEENIGYTDESWAAYQAALTEGTEFYNSVKDDPDAKTYQEEINPYVTAITDARSALTLAEKTTTEILSLRLTSATVARGKRAVLVITTTADVESLSIDGVAKLATCTSKPGVNSDGVQIKTWYISFVVSTRGTHVYTLHAGDATTEFTVICR